MTKSPHASEITRRRTRDDGKPERPPTPAPRRPRGAVAQTCRVRVRATEWPGDLGGLRLLIEHALAVLDDGDEPVATRVDQIAAALTRIEVLLEIVGPVALGLPSLIAYCADRSDTLAVSEDELLDEFWRNGRQLWEAELEAVASALAREQP